MEGAAMIFGITAQDLNPGTLRSEQNWIGWRGHRTPTQADFVPPPREAAVARSVALVARLSRCCRSSRNRVAAVQ